MNVQMRWFFLMVCVVTLSACGSSEVRTGAARVGSVIESPTPTPIQEAPTRTPPIAASESPTPTAAPQSGIEAAHLAGETIPDGTSLKAGEAFVKTFTLENVGETTWNEGYRLVFFASPQGETLGAGESVPLGKMVPPGETVEISIPLTAPQNPGGYTVVWQLVNERDEVIEVDQGNLWVSIRVGGGQGSFAGGVTVSLAALQVGEAETRVELCFDFSIPYGNEWIPQDISLLAGGKTYPAGIGGSIGTYPFSCTYHLFSIGREELAQYGYYQISVGKISDSKTLDDNQVPKCEAVKAQLQGQYPGLDYTCLPFTAGGYYRNLVVPGGVSREQIETLIVDGMNEAIYGPWVFTLVP